MNTRCNEEDAEERLDHLAELVGRQALTVKAALIRAFAVGFENGWMQQREFEKRFTPEVRT